MNDNTQANPIVRVATDLREIETLTQQLLDQATGSNSNSRLMPGGKPMVLLGPHSNLEAWEHRQQTTERTGKPYTIAADEDPEDHWDSLQILLYWSETTRRELGEDYGIRATLTTEAAYLRHRLEHLYQNQPDTFEQLATDIHTARTRLEDITHNGTRPERSRVVCTCDEEPRLIRVYGDTPDTDGWKCPNCRARYTQDDHARMFARMLRSEGANKFVPAVEAVALLRREGRPDQTIRKWINDANHVLTKCELATRRVLVFWPDLWHKHLTTERRPPRRRTPPA